MPVDLANGGEITKRDSGGNHLRMICAALRKGYAIEGESYARLRKTYAVNRKPVLLIIMWAPRCAAS